MNDILNILDQDVLVNEQVLEKYVAGTATPSEQHEIEKMMLQSQYFEAAVEGLTAFKNKDQLAAYNQMLKKTVRELAQKNKQKKKRKLLDTEPWTIAAVAIILLLCIVCYLVIKLI
jgi:hypothetical protein